MGRAPKLDNTEHVLVRCKATCTIRHPRRPLWQGDLYLTDSRIIWRRHGFTPPWPKPDRIDIRLADVRRAEAQDLAGAFGVIQIETADQDYSLIPYRFLLPLYIFFNGRLTQQFVNKVNELNRTL